MRHHSLNPPPSWARALTLILACAGALASAIAAAPAQSPGPTQLPAGSSESALTLWYRKPAAQWVEALPVGNGRLGAMVFGGIEHERLQLNEDTLWAGGPYDPSHAAAREALPRVRRLVADGAYAEAERLVMEQVIARSFGSIGKKTAKIPYPAITEYILFISYHDGRPSNRRDIY